MRDKRRLAFWFIELHADPDARAKGGGADKLDDALELTFYAHLLQASVHVISLRVCIHAQMVHAQMLLARARGKHEA